MSTPAKKPATTPIPVQLSETEFHEFILPHLSMPKLWGGSARPKTCNHLAIITQENIVVDMVEK